MRPFIFALSLLLLSGALVAGCRPVVAEPTLPHAQIDLTPIAAIHQEILPEVAAPSLAAPTEQVVTLESEGQIVVGTLALPAMGEAPYPAVLLLHGFTNTRDELPVAGTNEKMYTRLARVLGEHGIASLRIDFRGSGESDGEWADTTFTGQISDTLKAIDYLASRPEIAADRMGVLGFSQGGLVAAEAAAIDDRLQTVLLWSPVANPPDTYKWILSPESVAAGLQSGGKAIAVKTNWGAPLELKTGFFTDLFRFDPTAAIAEVKDPLMVIVGTRDATVTPQPYYGELFLTYHDGPEQLVTVDSDHVFNVVTDPWP
ncbi:MAG: alpha/beta fold hydrolase [Anaerolineales bacterium]|nr:alpha/beta fold hydrolase [Anaerolineales bacterium]